MSPRPAQGPLDPAPGSRWNTAMLDAALVILGYLAGSVSTGVLVARLLGLGDPRHDGSGNPGATNVLRLGGRPAALATLLGDALKGVVPVLIAQALELPGITVASVGGAAFLGHLYPVFFGFQGGKGIATGLGIFIAAAWPAGLAVALTWAVVAGLARISSLAALVSFALAPAYFLLITPAPALAAMAAGMALLTAWRHRGNIRRIANGTEPRIGQR
ncbi:glycerol-3-phosphate 1-O-acyltransferase PlsY [Spiribacter sp. SSL99]|uniref:glycerol-3-phosphate 1-O-acyltransferase PlsY n=1 Tax=Spiribacter sp. SSL99 TaxID=1866884 RepID=UPI00351A8028